MKPTRKRLDLSRWAPPGFKVSEDKAMLGFFTGAAVIWPIMSYGSRLADALRELDRYDTDTISYFHEILGNALLVIPIALAGMVSMAVMHYIYHWHGSRSIYLMRRLPRRWELHRRCLTLPLLGIVFFLLLGLVLFFAMYGIYLLAAPEGTVAPDQFEKLIELWRVM